MQYLVFRLSGPMASWGTNAVGGDRPTLSSPTRSAVVGLLAAALGIRRRDQEKLDSLNSAVNIASKDLYPGSLMKDFHTTQVVPEMKKENFFTRRDELSRVKDKVETILSNRFYRCDSVWVIAVYLNEDQSEYSLGEIEKALKAPVFSLSLGRKSCSLSVPLSPKLQKCENLKEALDLDFPPILSSMNEDRYYFGYNGIVVYQWEGDQDCFEGNVSWTSQWDDPQDRSKWQFRKRQFNTMSLEVD